MGTPGRNGQGDTGSPDRNEAQVSAEERLRAEVLETRRRDRELFEQAERERGIRHGAGGAAVNRAGDGHGRGIDGGGQVARADQWATGSGPADGDGPSCVDDAPPPDDNDAPPPDDADSPHDHGGDGAGSPTGGGAASGGAGAGPPRGGGSASGGDGGGIDWREVVAAYNDNQVGDARLFARLCGERYLFDNLRECWCRYEGTHWKVDHGQHAKAAVFEVAGLYARQAAYYESKAAELRPLGSNMDREEREGLRNLEKQRDAYNKRAFALKADARMRSVLALAGAGPSSLGIEGTEWNRYPDYLACKNTVIDLRTGKTVPPAPSQYLNLHSPVEWAGLNADCDDWVSFLDAVFEGDQELIDYVQKLSGYWLSGRMTHQEFYCLWGPRGRNGKGVFFRTLRAAMGDYYVTIPADLLLDQRAVRNSQGPSPVLLDLEDRRLAVASESSKRSKFSDDAIKSLTGGDPIRCRGLYSKNMIDVIPAFKMLFATNRIPSVDGGDDAFRARLRVIPFYCRFLPGASPDPKTKTYPMDPELEDRLQSPASLSGVLAWAVRGAIDYYRTMELTPPPVVQDLTDDYMDSNDLIGEFIEQALEITDATPVHATDATRTGGKDLYEHFKSWCSNEKKISDKYIMTMTAFGLELRNRPEIVKVPPKNRAFYNVNLVPFGEDDGDGGAF